MGVQINSAGTWKNVGQAWVKMAGVWSQVQSMYARQSGTWVDVTPKITLLINANTVNYSIKTAALATGWDGVTPVRVEVTVAAGVLVYSNDTSIAAMRTDTGWPAGSKVTIINNGVIVGMGGKGGNGMSGAAPQTGYPGGPALSISVATFLYNYGTIAGGGGGGAGGAQFTQTVSGGIDGTPTTTTYGGGGGSGGRTGLVNSLGGAGGSGNYYGYAGYQGTYSAAGIAQVDGQANNSLHPDGGAGGNWGQPGGNSNVAGGAAGKWVVGLANLTISANTGSLLGPTA